MKLRAGLELVVTIFFVFLLLLFKNVTSLPLGIKYLFDGVELIIILVAPGYFIQGLFFPELYGSLLIIRLAIAFAFSVSIWIIVVYILNVVGIGLDVPELFLLYAFFNIGLATLGLFRKEKTRTEIEIQGAERPKERKGQIGEILFYSIEAILIFGVIWLVGSIRSEALTQRGYTEFYFTRGVEIVYVANEDSMDIFVPITIVNQETVEAEYGIVAVNDEEAVGVVGSIRLAHGESWNGIVEVNLKNKNQLVEVDFLLAWGEEGFPYRNLMIKIDDVIVNEQELDLDDDLP